MVTPTVASAGVSWLTGSGTCTVAPAVAAPMTVANLKSGPAWAVTPTTAPGITGTNTSYDASPLLSVITEIVNSGDRAMLTITVCSVPVPASTSNCSGVEVKGSPRAMSPTLATPLVSVISAVP